MSHFIFEPGEWIGNGVVSFTHSPDVLHFRVQWDIQALPENMFQCAQRVEIVGGEQMLNMFLVKNTKQDKFDITLENEVLGTFSGKGLLEENVVAWEFRHRGVFDGYEIYERSDKGYSFRAEYFSSDQARTSIHGSIWEQE